MSHKVRRLVLVALCCTAGTALAKTPTGGVSGGGLPPAGSAAYQCADVSYNGGGLIENVKVVTVYWGMSAAADRANIDAAYVKMVQSPYLDWLREYDAGGYKIRRGTLAASVIDPSPPSKTTVDDQGDIVPHLGKLIDNKVVPAPDDDTLYMIHFPSTVRVTMYGSSSCQEFCAYHSSFDHNGQAVRYGVMPDQNAGGCQNGCGVSGGQPVDSTSLTASHELMEAITDPDPGSGWYGQNSAYCGEVGDICNAMPGTANGATVQKTWSNKLGTCIDHDSSVKVIDFALALGQASVTGYLGKQVTNTVTATPATNAASGNATLTVTGLPAGVTVSTMPAMIATNAMATLTFDVAATTATGSYTYTVTGASKGDNVLESVTGTIVVMDAPPPPPDMGMTGGNGGGGGGSGGGSGSGMGGDGNGDNGADNPGGGVGSGGDGSGSAPSSGCEMGGALAGSFAGGSVLLGILLLLVARIVGRRRWY